jgi:murein DD-endopeptidase MepM/ murein hydrolase activator NlpD
MAKHSAITTGIGSHLHYETRVDGEAVDPNRFLRACWRQRRATCR